MNGLVPIARAANTANDWNRTSSTVAVGTAGVLIKGAANGRLIRARVENVSASTVYYIMIFDKATVPINGDTPIYRHRIAGSTGETIDLGSIGGIACATGIGFAISTAASANFLTLAGSNDAHFEIHWK